MKVLGISSYKYKHLCHSSTFPLIETKLIYDSDTHFHNMPFISVSVLHLFCEILFHSFPWMRPRAPLFEFLQFSR